MDRVDYEKIVVQEIVNLHRNQELNISPWYQRRAVWTRAQQAFLINTLFERKPVPSIYVRHSIDLVKERSVREVVDGQQRIRSILEYREGKFSARHPRIGKRMKYVELSKADKEHFLMTPLSVGYLIGATEADVIDIFGRINSVSKTLNPQEKRNAKFGGEFKQFCLSKSSELIQFWRNAKIFSDNDIARMQEVQFVSDVAMNFSIGLSDYSPSKLDKYYEDNSENYKDWDKVSRLFDSVFGRLNELPVDFLANSNFSREPLLFSLCYVLKDFQKLSVNRLQSVMTEVDSIIDLESATTSRLAREVEFIKALTSTTQRLSSRKVRDTFLRRYFN